MNKPHYFSALIFLAFSYINRVARISNLHHTADGWSFVITDHLTGHEYFCHATPIKSEITAMPDTADEFLKLTEGGIKP